MKCKHIILAGILLIVLVLLSSCINESKPEGTLSVSELLQNPVYNTEVTIYGKVSLLGEIKCPCFELTSGKESVLVWYAWYEDDLSTVSVQDIENGDQVIVTGELKPGDTDGLYEFAASRIEK
jgi:hypothetical protein